MQNLQFEASWDKALSLSDRQMIEGIFRESSKEISNGVHFAPIREAINHKGELLVTVLVHNITDQLLKFENAKLQYIVHGEVIAQNRFTFPSLEIPPRVSMPWTFIFPKDSYSPNAAFRYGQLELEA